MASDNDAVKLSAGAARRIMAATRFIEGEPTTLGTSRRKFRSPMDRICKVEMIEDLWGWDERLNAAADATEYEPAKAWPIVWNEDDEGYRRGPEQVTVYGNAGFFGFAFGAVDAANEESLGDIIHARYINGRFYGISGRAMVIVKTNASHAKGVAGDCTMWDGVKGSETQTERVISCHNRFASLSSGKWAMAAWAGRGWDLISGECS